MASGEEAVALEVIIVASRGERELLRDCLQSLEHERVRGGRMRVVIVDNASPEGIASWVDEAFPWANAVRLSWNAGFTGGNNVALRRSAAPYVLLLNPDTVVAQGALDHMIGVLERDPSIGVAGCRLELLDGSFDHAAKRAFPTVLGSLGHFVRLGQHPRAPKWLAQYRAPTLGEFDCGEVDSVNGAFMLVRREALDEVGPLDERYWMYMDDLDWCYRFKQRGWKAWYEGSVSIVHVKGGASVHVKRRGRHRGLKLNIAFHRGMGRFYRKFYSGRRPLMDLAVYLGIGAKLVLSIVRSAVARRSIR